MKGRRRLTRNPQHCTGSRDIRAGLSMQLTSWGGQQSWGATMSKPRPSTRKVLSCSQDAGVKVITAESIEGLVCAAGAEGEGKRAAKLFGAAQMLREVVGYHSVPAEEALR